MEILDKIFGFNGTSVNMSTTEIIITALAGPFGQLYLRNEYLGGSLKSWWLLFFSIPPFSFFPVYMIKWGYIKAEGNGGKPLDYLALIPIVCKFFLMVLLQFTSIGMGSFLNGIIILLSIFVANSIHFYLDYKCYNSKKTSDEKEPETNFLHLISKVAVNSGIEFGFPVLFNIALKFIPVVGSIISILESVSYIGKYINELIWSIGFATIYMLLNMIDVNARGNSICSDKPSMVYIIIAIIGILVGYFL